MFFFLCREVTLGTGKNRIGDTIRALNICTMNECMVFLLSVEKKICGKEANKKRAQFSDLSHPSHYRIIYFYERKHIKTKLQNSMPNCLGVCACVWRRCVFNYTYFYGPSRYSGRYPLTSPSPSSVNKSTSFSIQFCRPRHLLK